MTLLAFLFLPLVLTACEAGDEVQTLPAPAEAAASDPGASPAQSPAQNPGNATNATSGNMGSAAASEPHRLTEGELNDMRIRIATDLNNAAVAEENYFVDHRVYTLRVNDLIVSGYRQSPNVVVRIVDGDSRKFCIEAYDANDPTMLMYFSSPRGSPVVGSCP